MILQITHEGQLVGRYISLTEASERTDIDKGSICKVLKGQRKSAGGFKWEREEDEIDNDNINIKSQYKLREYLKNKLINKIIKLNLS